MTSIIDSGEQKPFRVRPGTKCLNLLEVQDRVLADFLPQMVWIIGADDRRVLFANSRFQEYHGTVDDAWDQRLERFHADDQTAITHAFETAARDGHTPDVELRIADKDGHYRWHKVTLVPIKRDDHIAEWVVTALDVDETVQSRQELREATDLFSLSQQAAGAGSWDLDLRTSAVKLSRESARLHGVGCEAVKIDLEGWQKIVNADDAKIVLDSLQQAVDTRTIFNGEFRVRLADSSLRWLSGIGRAYYDADGNPVRMIGLNFDITARKTAEGQLLEAHVQAQTARDLADRARRDAERASSAKSDFLASMSHEIRTPLNSIIGYTDLLMEDAAHDSPFRRKLEVVQEAGAALLTVVNDILDFSKIEAGQVEINPAAFSSGALLDNVCSMLSGQAHRKGMTLSRSLGSDVPDYLFGDAGRLRQILLNLVNNAVKFTDSGRVTVSVTKDQPANPDRTEWIRFAVTDTGIGISPDQQQRLFQRFSQLDGSVNRRFGGSGLGLAISKQLVELMQGEIGLESRSGEGSTFWFRVPLPRAQVPQDDGKLRIDNKLASASAFILLVEDIPVNQDLARTVLERAGHRVDVAWNGLEAVEAVRTGRYNVVLMDVQMPVMDGLSAAKAIRAADHESRSVPIIAMTANVLPHQVTSLKMSGMNDHVGKPFRRDELLQAIDRWAKRSPSSEPIGLDLAARADSERVDTKIFAALEDMIGERSFRVVVAKLSNEMTTRFHDLSLSCEPHRIRRDAHALIQAAGSFGFTRFLTLLRHAEEGKISEAFLQDLDGERRLVIADLDHYLASGRS